MVSVYTANYNIFGRFRFNFNKSKMISMMSFNNGDKEVAVEEESIQVIPESTVSLIDDDDDDGTKEELEEDDNHHSHEEER